MGEIRINDFSGGWSPGEDPINGRKNILLKMDNCELDKNGALILCGGTNAKWSGFAADAHTLYSRIINGARADYSATTDGHVYRNNVSIATGGDNSNAGFGKAFNFTLIASGSKRIKDDGTTIRNLGILPPTATPTVTYSIFNAPDALIGAVVTNTVTPVGTSAVISGTYLQITSDTNGVFVVQTYADPGAPYNVNQLTGIGGEIGVSTDDDYIQVSGFTPIVTGRSLTIDVLLIAGNSSGDAVSDYYSYTIADLSTVQFSAIGVFTVRIKRSDFTRVGPGSQDWSTVYGFRLTYTGGASGELVNMFGDSFGNSTMVMRGGSHAQNGVYQYLQVNVNNTGSYIAKSIGGPASPQVTIEMGQARITPLVPSSIDPQANEAWIYRLIGGIWYRVMVFDSTTGFSARYDAFSDIDAETLDIELDISLISVADIPDKIFDIIGPISGRWFYFTTNFMYPSDFNDPDLVSPNLAVRTTGSNNELYLSARLVDRATVAVMTTEDGYILTGTFQTLPDGTIDVYYLSMGLKYPGITCDAVATGGTLYYLAKDGWRTVNGTGQASFTGNTNPSLVSPQLDRLYRGETVQGYLPPNLKQLPRSFRMPVVLQKNKVYCFITGLATPRIEIYDTVRNYWRPVNYGLGDVSAATDTPDGQVIAFFKTDKTIREIDVQPSKLIDGSSSNAVNLLFPVADGGAPRNRKDMYTLKVRGSALANYSVFLQNDLNVSTTVANWLASGNVKDQFFDLSQQGANVALIKTVQFALGGLGVPITDFSLNDISVVYDQRPDQITFIRGLNNNFNTGERKRVRTIPFVIDPIGSNVTIVVGVDNVLLPSLTVTGTVKQTFFFYVVTDYQPVDIQYTLQSTGLMEFYGTLPPTDVEIIPIGKKFDQIGPQEMFRFGKLQEMELRVKPEGVNSIPWTIYFDDNTILTGAFSVIDGKDGTYFQRLPKGVNGHVIRVELGPTSFPFHRFYMRFLMARSGKDTDNEWITVQ